MDMRMRMGFGSSMPAATLEVVVQIDWTMVANTVTDTIHAGDYTTPSTLNDEEAAQITPGILAGAATVLRDSGGNLPTLKVSGPTYNGGRTALFSDSTTSWTTHDGASGFVNSAPDLFSTNGYAFIVAGHVVDSGFASIGLTHCIGVSGVLSVVMDYVDSNTLAVGIRHTDAGGSTDSAGNVDEGQEFRIGAAYDEDGKLTVALAIGGNAPVVLLDESTEGELVSLADKAFNCVAPSGWDFAVGRILTCADPVSKTQLLAAMAAL